MFTRNFMFSHHPLCILNFDIQCMAFSNQIFREQARNFLSNQCQKRLLEPDCIYLFNGSKAQINLRKVTKDTFVIGTGFKELGYLYKTERLFLWKCVWCLIKAKGELVTPGALRANWMQIPSWTSQRFRSVWTSHTLCELQTSYIRIQQNRDCRWCWNSIANIWLSWNTVQLLTLCKRCINSWEK